ncbi:hypothetical protein PROFUN_12945 [Planoprotostelium fungivorum]|uniref:PAS domain-containing protein n=1 Tax=Planoprotostelium fungivorum TaxID=1890364 RepID=A0A2P6N5X2_9EUKA|nr:hypothetical protein PROFUN_12945 [Planoprotostelium fungivorum]
MSEQPTLYSLALEANHSLNVHESKFAKYGRSCDNCRRSHVACNGAVFTMFEEKRGKYRQPSPSTPMVAVNQEEPPLKREMTQHTPNELPLPHVVPPPAEINIPIVYDLEAKPLEAWMAATKHAIDIGRVTETQMQALMKMITAMNERRLQQMKFINSQQKEHMISDYQLRLENLIAQCIDIEAPAYIYSHFGVVQYVNPAFRRFTGFDGNLPSAVSQGLLYELFHLSEVEDGEIIEHMRRKVVNGGEDQFVWVPASLRVWEGSSAVKTRMHYTSGQDMYVEGTICTTVKKDLLNLPILFYCIFLPSPSSIRKSSLKETME